MGHSIFGTIAYGSLPAWERELITPDMSPAALGKPYIPDTVKTVGDKMGWACTLMDLVYEDECRPYAVLADGRWIPHSPPDEMCQSTAGSGRPIC